MRVIYKYELTNLGNSTIEMPIDSMVKDFAAQGERLFLWAEVQTNNPLILRRFKVMATGEDIPDGYGYLKTTHVDGFVWHLYEDRSMHNVNREVGNYGG